MRLSLNPGHDRLYRSDTPKSLQRLRGTPTKMAGDVPRPADRTLPRIGSYDLIEPLGTGGMSSVFRARHVESGVEVAVKVLPRSLAKNPAVLQRFLREAKSAEALQHPNIVAIYDRGVDQGRNYLVLEYVHGGDLHDKVRAEGPLEVDQAASVVRQVAEGLNYAAGEGLIHRDIKPANLLVTPEGQVKIIDLGLALHAESEDERVTREGTTVGTVDYMAPEQARDSRATSIRSDIYSLGCTFVFLLTGQPPFPGGDVADKLNRHINVLPDDPRERRPEVPDALSRIILKMLAKQPEARYAGYSELIEALEGLKHQNGSKYEPGPGAPPQSLFALLDDEPDSEIELAPADDGIPLWLPDRSPGRTADGFTPSPSNVSMADLAELDLTEEGPRRPAPERPSGPSAALPRSRTSTPRPRPVEALPVEIAPEDEDVHDKADNDHGDVRLAGSLPQSVPRVDSRGMTDSEKSWVTKIVVGAVALVALVIIADTLIRTPPSDPAASENSAPEDPAIGNEPVQGQPVQVAVASPKPVNVPPPVVDNSKSAVSIKAVAPKSKDAPEPTPPPWLEPADPAPERVGELTFAVGLEARFLPDWAAALAASIPRPPGKSVTVRRIPDPRDPDQRPSLRLALDVVGGGMVELADNGPFFEDDLRLVGDSRLIRARPGFRPIVAVERPRIDARLTQPVFLDLGEKTVAFDGIDLVVDVADLPPSQAALFQLRGGSLTFRNCSITVVNRSGRPFTIVKTVPSSKTSKVFFDRSLVRGSFLSAVETSGGGSDVVVLRSVVLNGQGGAFSAAVPAAVSGVLRRVSVVRSIIGTRGPAFELSDTSPTMKPRPHTARALGTTFARFQTNLRASLVAARGEYGTASELIDWQGEGNTFAGWYDWLSAGQSHNVRVASLKDARTIWPGTDPNSDSTPNAWPLPLATEVVSPSQLRVHAPSRLAVLTRVATPNPYLSEMTLSAFARPQVPGVSGVAPTVAAFGGAELVKVSGPNTNASIRFVAEGGVFSEHMTDAPPKPPIPGGGAGPHHQPPPSAPGSSAAGNTSASGSGRDLVFDTETTPYQGDLGIFLVENVRADDTVVRVKVKGTSLHSWSPVRLPDGVSLQIVVEPGLNGLTPSWSVPPSATAEASIELRGGSLVMVGVNLSRDGSRNLKRLVLVQGGHLVLARCRLTAPGSVETDGGGLIAFNSPGTGPVKSVGGSTWPFDTPVDRPTCRVIEGILSTGGEVFSSELGRGLLAFNECAVVSGSSAFTLQPGRVARGRLEADLLLDHCTVTSERAFVTLGPWRGSDPGPDRPWLVSTSNCAFFGLYDRPDQESVLLRADPGGLAHGALFWQSHRDALEVPTFLAATDAPLPAAHRPDVRLHWQNLWGDTHAREVTGPRLVGGQPGARPVGRLKPGSVEPGDLAIDPDSPSGRRAPAVGVDLSRLGITPSPRPGRRR
jgi:serine/threonine protein kinase